MEDFAPPERGSAGCYDTTGVRLGDSIARSVGRYRIVDSLGEGAMANVYRAHDPEIGRDIAIKILKSDLCRDDEIKSRFSREARTAGGLSHPHIVTVYDVGEADGFPYIAMELLEGQSLSDRIALRGRLPLEEALRVGQQIASALHYAHGLGVVHRDIKPSNIILCGTDGTTKLLDFGIAHRSQVDAGRSEFTAVHTQVGQVLGTPRYMSPEQALGTTIDHRSDLFSLGALLYEMVAGEPAFGGASFATITIQVVRDQPRALNNAATACPAGVRQIIDKLLAKDPEARFATSQEVVDALERELKRLRAGKSARPRLPLELRRTAAVVVVVAALLAWPAMLVADRQQAAVEQAATASGNTVANFVAANIGLLAADNSSLPEAQQDWLPVQAFVRNAAKDPAIGQIVIRDARGVVRASSKSATFTGGALIRQDVVYAGRNFGRVDLTLNKAHVDALAAGMRNSLLELLVSTLLAVTAAVYIAVGSIAVPMRRFARAVAGGCIRPLPFDHQRTDELGEIFNRYNGLVDAQLNVATTIAPRSSGDAELTRIDPGLAGPARLRA